MRWQAWDEGERNFRECPKGGACSALDGRERDRCVRLGFCRQLYTESLAQLSKVAGCPVVYMSGQSTVLVLLERQPHNLRLGIYTALFWICPDGNEGWSLMGDDGNEAATLDDADLQATITVKFDGDMRLYTEEWCMDAGDAADVLRAASAFAGQIFPHATIG